MQEVGLSTLFPLDKKLPTEHRLLVSYSTCLMLAGHWSLFGYVRIFLTTCWCSAGYWSVAGIFSVSNLPTSHRSLVSLTTCLSVLGSVGDYEFSADFRKNISHKRKLTSDLPTSGRFCNWPMTWITLAGLIQSKRFAWWWLVWWHLLQLFIHTRLLRVFKY